MSLTEKTAEQIMAHLLHLRNEYRRIESELEEIRRSIPAGGFFRGDVWHPVEDEDDFRIWSLRPRKQMHGIKADMRRWLAEASKLSLKSDLITEIRGIIKE